MGSARVTTKYSRTPPLGGNAFDRDEPVAANGFGASGLADGVYFYDPDLYNIEIRVYPEQTRQLVQVQLDKSETMRLALTAGGWWYQRCPRYVSAAGNLFHIYSKLCAGITLSISAYNDHELTQKRSIDAGIIN